MLSISFAASTGICGLAGRCDSVGFMAATSSKFLVRVHLHQDPGDLGAGEFHRGRLASGEHLPYLGPGEDHMPARGTWAGLERRHSLAGATIAGVLET